MADLVTTLRLAAGALGSIGGILLFLEFFQVPNYIEFDPDFGEYDFDLAPAEVAEYTWLGRIGALLMAVAFALQFLGAFLG